MSLIKAYRLVKRKYAHSAFDGIGSKIRGGRWNSIGVACVYAAECESLAILETIVHLHTDRHFHEWCMYEFDIEERHLLRLSLTDLPTNWFETPSPVENAELGDEWIASKDSAGLLLPSTVAHRDNNIILNPEHPGFASIVKTAREVNFSLDNRL